MLPKTRTRQLTIWRRCRSVGLPAVLMAQPHSWLPSWGIPACVGMALTTVRPAASVLQGSIRMVKALFRDQQTTEFIIATIPTVLGINESSRLAKALKKEQIPCKRIVVNQIVRDNMSRWGPSLWPAGWHGCVAARAGLPECRQPRFTCSTGT